MGLAGGPPVPLPAAHRNLPFRLAWADSGDGLVMARRVSAPDRGHRASGWPPCLARGRRGGRGAGFPNAEEATAAVVRAQPEMHSHPTHARPQAPRSRTRCTKSDRTVFLRKDSWLSPESWSSPGVVVELLLAPPDHAAALPARPPSPQAAPPSVARDHRPVAPPAPRNARSLPPPAPQPNPPAPEPASRLACTHRASALRPPTPAPKLTRPQLTCCPTPTFPAGTQVQPQPFPPELRSADSWGFTSHHTAAIVDALPRSCRSLYLQIGEWDTEVPMPSIADGEWASFGRLAPQLDELAVVLDGDTFWRVEQGEGHFESPSLLRAELSRLLPDANIVIFHTVEIHQFLQLDDPDQVVQHLDSLHRLFLPELPDPCFIMAAQRSELCGPLAGGKGPSQWMAALGEIRRRVERLAKRLRRQGLVVTELRGPGPHSSSREDARSSSSCSTLEPVAGRALSLERILSGLIDSGNVWYGWRQATEVLHHGRTELVRDPRSLLAQASPALSIEWNVAFFMNFTRTHTLTTHARHCCQN
eukprot:scaffold2264_cov114-Isochrysis_galbana.AAC.7